ncbi:hypothetical protein JW824_07670 [bacterium]|nr:hypothetical protein [bacterium]
MRRRLKKVGVKNIKKSRIILSIGWIWIILLLYTCSNLHDALPVVFYEKELKGVIDLSKDEYSPDMLEIRRSLEDHLKREPPLVPLEGVSERDLISVRVNTGYTFKSFTNRIKAKEGVYVRLRQTDGIVVDTDNWQIHFTQDLHGFIATFVLDKKNGLQMSPKDFFLQLRQ